MAPILRFLPLFLALLLSLALAGCSSMYYASMEKLGKEKRDILVQRVVDGKKDQEKAKQQLKTTLEAFQELTGFEGGNLEKTYKKLNGSLEDAEGRAKDLSDRVASIDKVANDLFAEWEKEASEMKNGELRGKSRRILRATKQRHQQYMSKMRTTERKIAPVLQAFRDQVTFLKHNLNAKAIGSLKGTSTKLDADVAALITDIESSIVEADSFIQSLSAS